MIDKICERIHNKRIRHKFSKVLHVSDKSRLKLDTQIIISDEGTITIGNEFSINNRVSLSSIGGHIKIGDRVAINRNCIIVCRKNIYIEDDCIFGPNVIIYDHDHVFSYEGVQKSEFNCSDIRIGKGCWIGANATILRGTHIGEKSIIGAGVVVKGEIPPHSLVLFNRDKQIVKIEKIYR